MGAEDLIRAIEDLGDVVVFPDTWDGFFGENDVWALLRRYGREAVQIAAAVFRVEQHDLDYAGSLSY